uniref:Uncharacterized protein n=1 Tax=uncultured organism MedDCM-OCT-S04-C777 TaxID=743619 RepID=D6PK80_9ZZZZ|nr:hypothetical protein [uncultured organism MedDCM-OCT-S04-C777]
MNALNLKTGMDLEDGYNAKPFEQNSVEKSSEPTYMDDEVDVEEIINRITETKLLNNYQQLRAKLDQLLVILKTITSKHTNRLETSLVSMKSN